MEFTIFWSALTIATGIYFGLVKAAYVLRGSRKCERGGCEE